MTLVDDVPRAMVARGNAERGLPRDAARAAEGQRRPIRHFFTSRGL